MGKYSGLNPFQQVTRRTRRQFLKWGAVSAALTSLPGCAALGLSRELPKAKSQIFVDAHTHIFNAEDLAIEGFVNKVILSYPKNISTFVIDKLSQWKAPKAKNEEKKIDKILIELKGQEYSYGKNTRILSGAALGVRLVHRYTTKRFRNANRLIRTYQNSTPWANDRLGIDRFVVALVDMDYWVNDFAVTSLVDQIRITGKISKMFPGRLCPFVAFDPFRNIVENGKPLEWVKDAINNHGFIGVKLYPPMGFRPYGNTELDKDGVAWPKHFRQPFRDGKKMKVAKYLRHDETETKRIRNMVSDLANQRENGLGFQLDHQLDALFTWCVANDVPVMAHANDSNGAKDGSEMMAAPEHWEKALMKHPNLRINLGHFGGWDDVVDNNNSRGWSDKIVTLMSKYPNVYADTGNFHKIRHSADHSSFAAGIRRLFELHDGVLKKRLLYASDWFMSSVRPCNEEYFTDFNNFLYDNFNDERNAIMSSNALDFLGPRGK